MNGSILLKIRDGWVEIFLNCDSYKQEAVLSPIVDEIRRVVEEALASVASTELVTVED